MNFEAAGMTEVFIDTSGWAVFFLRSESFHATAEALMRSWRSDGTLAVTSNYVLSELVALFSSPIRVPRPRVIEIIEAIVTSRHVEVVHIDAGLHERAWMLLKSRSDKAWSLVDCTSFVVMSERRILDALTTDKHFEQAGYHRLLK